MNIQLLSSKYSVRNLLEKDIADVLKICEGNPMFYEYCPPSVTYGAIKKDMQALPPKKTMKDKFYLGFYHGDKLIAIMDLIIRFPNEETAFIGFFMLDKAMQGKGISSEIATECFEYLNSIGFKKIKLGYAKGNAQSEHFWAKNGFAKTGIETQAEGYVIVVMEKIL